MYALKLAAGHVVGQMSLVKAVKKMGGNAVVVGVVRLSDGKLIK